MLDNIDWLLVEGGFVEEKKAVVEFKLLSYSQRLGVFILKSVRLPKALSMVEITHPFLRSPFCHVINAVHNIPRSLQYNFFYYSVNR